MIHQEQEEKLRHVQIVHVLNSGQTIIDSKKFEKEFKDLFNIDDIRIRNEIFRLRQITSSWNKSILYIKQNGEFYSKVDVPEDTEI